MNSIALSYDPDSDVLTIEGYRYHGDLFRQLGYALPEGRLFRLIKRQDETLTLGSFAPEVERRMLEIAE